MGRRRRRRRDTYGFPSESEMPLRVAASLGLVVCQAAIDFESI
jgi:hypothetical protein